MRRGIARVATRDASDHHVKEDRSCIACCICARARARSRSCAASRRVNLNTATKDELDRAAGHRPGQGAGDPRLPQAQRPVQVGRRPEGREGHRCQALEKLQGPSSPSRRRRSRRLPRRPRPTARPTPIKSEVKAAPRRRATSKRSPRGATARRSRSRTADRREPLAPHAAFERRGSDPRRLRHGAAGSTRFCNGATPSPVANSDSLERGRGGP